MGREFQGDLEQILLSSRRRETLDLYLANGTHVPLSRGVVERTIEEKIVYNNWIKSISEMRYYLEGSVNRVNVVCQNVNTTLGLNIASNLRLLDYALAFVGKTYQKIGDPEMLEDIPTELPGVVANASANEKEITFEVVSDLDALGKIIANRAVSPRCWWKVGNGFECTVSATECAKTRAACVKLHSLQSEDEAEFGGWEFFEQPTSAAPGSGGNEGGGIGGCFAPEIKVWSPRGQIPIGDFPVGIQKKRTPIVSFDKKTGAIDYNDEILEVWEDEFKGCFTLQFEHDLIDGVSGKHKFLQAFNRFRIADKFKPGFTTKVFNDRWFGSKLLNVKWNSERVLKMRNLRVKRNRTFFANGCAVSNSKDEEILL